MENLNIYEAWLVTGSQHLYGPEVLDQVAAHSKEMVQTLNASESTPVRIVFKPVVKTAEEILQVCMEANAASNCIGVITWMHTFSPAKMWIAGLKALQKPILHLHTQFNRDIPWSDIDMDFMNLNQSAHGDREYGFMLTRMRLERKVVVGHWQDPDVQQRIAVWTRAAAAWRDAQGARFARLGDNMREVAVTEGDKVEAQLVFGWSVNGYAMGDLVNYVEGVTDSRITTLTDEYESSYTMDPALRKGGAHYVSLREAARIELGMRDFLTEGGFKGFTDTFENLRGLVQLPGIAVQRLMKDGYGFGAEGDWKTAAMVRAMKVMAAGLPGGNTFMEDYTYHLNPSRMLVLGAHMLEICESIADGKPACEIHPLGIGGKADPVRLCFNVAAGPAMNVSILDMGSRFRLLVNEVEAVVPEQNMPKLPVARVLWDPKPNLRTAAAAWIYAGGAHHTVFSQNLTTEYIRDFADMAGVELVTIDQDTRIDAFRNQLRWNDLYYHLAKGI
ncbi:MAG: L-arabinose isomerase [Bacteroidales bacterium]|nr:L-arabinose isomerase [Bacteroidales bacterium]MDD3871929.1 L-arabinose isomerase [Bacteroidales bacterium]MDD4813115.1 L-arabinose isomerase [Bacteroidales bacterium]